MASQSTNNERIERKPNAEHTFYWQHYGLHRDPFSAIPDNEMAMLIPRWEQHIELIRHLIFSENALLSVIGAKGSGKSTWFYLFNKHIGDSMFIHQVTASQDFSIDQLIDILADGFKLPKQDTELVEEKLDSVIVDIQYQERPCILVIDDAHLLPIEVLQTLIYLIKQQSTNQMRFHVLLLGETHLQVNLNDLAKHELSNDLIHTIDLQALNLEETRKYLQHRLSRAGLSGSMPFTIAEIEQIFQSANGLPDAINRYAQQTLLDNIARQNPALKQSFLNQHQAKILGGALMVIVVVLASMFLSHENYSHWQGNQEAQKQPTLTFSKNSQTIAVPKSGKPLQLAENNQHKRAIDVNPQDYAYHSTHVSLDNDNHATDNNRNAAADNAATNDAAIHSQKLQQQASIESQQSSGQPIKLNSHQASLVDTQSNSSQSTNDVNSYQSQGNVFRAVTKKPAAGSESQSTPKATKPEAQKSKQPAVKTVHKDAVKHHNKGKTVTATNTTKATVKAKPIAKQVASKNTRAKAISSKQTVSKQKPHQSSSKAQLKRKHEVKHLASKHFIKPDIATANKHHYTLQVLAVSHENHLKQFIAKNKLSNKTEYISTNLHGKPWYILIYGDYPSLTAAKEALKVLPAALKPYHAWPRQFAELKHEANKQS